jgi:hypothetical protein
MKTIAKTFLTGVSLIFTSSGAFAIQYDLVGNGSQTVPGAKYPGGTTANAVFVKGSVQTSGTGAIDPFLRVHDNDNFEQGFNTSNPGGGNPDGMNAINSVHTHDLELATLQYVNLAGINYYQFMLDLGEPTGGSQVTILLEKFNLYTGNNDAPTPTEIASIISGDVGKRFDLAGNTILFIDETSGNGASDVFIYVPIAAFAGVTDKYLYLYTELGLADSGNDPSNADGTFEEFAARVGPNEAPPTVPDGGTTSALLGIACIALSTCRRFIKP